MVKEKQSGDVFAMKTLKKSQTLAQESVSITHYFIKNSITTGRDVAKNLSLKGLNTKLRFGFWTVHL